MIVEQEKLSELGEFERASEKLLLGISMEHSLQELHQIAKPQAQVATAERVCITIT